MGFTGAIISKGLFLSSAVVKNPDYTCELLIQTLRLLREEYGFRGVYPCQSHPGADNRLLTLLGMLADRMSVNIELPSERSLKLLAPDKSKRSILQPMGLIAGKIQETRYDLIRYRSTPKFAPAGQSTQMIIGATPDTDWNILRLTEGLYRKYGLRRVFLLRLYAGLGKCPTAPQGDKTAASTGNTGSTRRIGCSALGFTADELLDGQHPNFHPLVDPKCGWAVNHMEQFPVEINTAPYEIAIARSRDRRAQRPSVSGRRAAAAPCDFDGLKKIGVVLKRAQYFITCSGKSGRDCALPQRASCAP